MLVASCCSPNSRHLADCRVRLKNMCIQRTCMSNEHVRPHTEGTMCNACSTLEQCCVTGREGNVCCMWRPAMATPRWSKACCTSRPMLTAEMRFVLLCAPTALCNCCLKYRAALMTHVHRLGPCVLSLLRCDAEGPLAAVC